MKACVKCGCTDKRACLEFDAEGYAHPCYWVDEDTCSACANERYDPALSASCLVREPVETRLLVAPYLGRKKITPAQYRRQFLCAPALAGMVARPRR